MAARGDGMIGYVELSVTPAVPFVDSRQEVRVSDATSQHLCVRIYARPIVMVFQIPLKIASDVPMFANIDIRTTM